MQILISVIINLVILAVTLPLFYIYIVSRARERLEKETMSKAREEIEALVKEFNNIALSRISILEDSIVRAGRLVKELNGVKDTDKNDKYTDKINNKQIIKEETKTEENNINIAEEVKENKEELEEVKINTADDNTEEIQSEAVPISVNANKENKKEKKLDIRVDDENIKLNTKIEKEEKEKNQKTEIKEKKEEKIKEEVKPKPKKSNIDTAAKAIDDEARREVIEKLRSKLDKTIKTNMAIYDKPIEDKTIAYVNEPLEDSMKGYSKNDDIIKLYKQGLSKEDIAKKLKCSITEIDIVIDLNMD